MTVFLCVVLAHTNATDRPPQQSDFSLNVPYSCAYKENFAICNMSNAYRRDRMTICFSYLEDRGSLRGSGAGYPSFPMKMYCTIHANFVLHCNLTVRDCIICVVEKASLHKLITKSLVGTGHFQRLMKFRPVPRDNQARASGSIGLVHKFLRFLS
jgi:hypothetical protein